MRLISCFLLLLSRNGGQHILEISLLINSPELWVWIYVGSSAGNTLGFDFDFWLGGAGVCFSALWKGNFMFRVIICTTATSFQAFEEGWKRDFEWQLHLVKSVAYMLTWSWGCWHELGMLTWNLGVVVTNNISVRKKWYWNDDLSTGDVFPQPQRGMYLGIEGLRSVLAFFHRVSWEENDQDVP